MTTPKKKTTEPSEPSEPSGEESGTVTTTQPPFVVTLSSGKTSAIVAELDYGNTLDATAFDATTPRHSRWTKQLEQLLSDTRAGKVPTGDDGMPLYVRVGVWAQAGGAQQMIRNFEKSEGRKLPAGGDWDFQKKIVTGADGTNSSELWARALPVSED